MAYSDSYNFRNKLKYHNKRGKLSKETEDKYLILINNFFSNYVSYNEDGTIETDERKEVDIPCNINDMMHKVIISNVGLILSYIDRNINAFDTSYKQEEMYNEGYLGFYEGLKSFNPEKGKLTTHAYQWIMAYAYELKNNYNELVRKSSNHRLLSGKIAKNNDSFFKDNGYYPGNDYLCKTCSCTEKQIKALNNSFGISISTQIGGDDSESESTIADLLKSDIFADEQLAIIANKQYMSYMVKRIKHPAKQLILNMLFGLNEYENHEPLITYAVFPKKTNKLQKSAKILTDHVCKKILDEMHSLNPTLKLEFSIEEIKYYKNLLKYKHGIFTLEEIQVKNKDINIEYNVKYLSLFQEIAISKKGKFLSDKCLLNKVNAELYHRNKNGKVQRHYFGTAERNHQDGAIIILRKYIATYEKAMQKVAKVSKVSNPSIQRQVRNAVLSNPMITKKSEHSVIKQEIIKPMKTVYTVYDPLA